MHMYMKYVWKWNSSLREEVFLSTLGCSWWLGCVTSGMTLLGKLKSHLLCGKWGISVKTPYWAWISSIKIKCTSLFSLLFMKARPKQ